MNSIKTLKWIEELGLSKIDWKRVQESYPQALEVTIDPNRDSMDFRFIQNEIFGINFMSLD